MKSYKLLYLPYQGEYKQLPHKSNSDKPVDEYEIVALAKRLNISIEDMKQMSFVSLMNILISAVDNGESEEKEASQEDIDSFFG